MRLRGWAAALAAWCLVGSAAAQQAPADPLNGQFGMIEAASAPGEALSQARMLGQALGGLAPQRAGRLDVYLLVASFWSDPVFLREAAQAETILKDHFGAEGRSILLAAAPAGSQRIYAAATPNNLNAAIAAIGATIDAQEDMVVVFLTSHGSPDGSMALMEKDRLQGALRPVHLRDALAAAGVRNRVVIVSACYSGAFIAPLMDERTAVFTAAAHDRTSFGCQPERDWTFFGDALFNHALRNGASLSGGFDQAKTLIGQWERERNLTPPSNPQRYVGPRAAALLAQAERR